MALLGNKFPYTRKASMGSKTLLNELGSLPLAISQAVAYMRQYRLKPSMYLQESRNYLRNPGTHHDSMFDYRRDHGQVNAVEVSLLMSFVRLSNEKPKAAWLLKLMSCYDYQTISTDLLHEVYGKEFRIERRQVGITNEQEFLIAIAIATLANMALAEEILDGQAYKVHRLVSMAARKWILCCQEESIIVNSAAKYLLRHRRRLRLAKAVANIEPHLRAMFGGALGNSMHHDYKLECLYVLGLSLQAEWIELWSDFQYNLAFIGREKGEFREVEEIEGRDLCAQLKLDRSFSCDGNMNEIEQRWADLCNTLTKFGRNIDTIEDFKRLHANCDMAPYGCKIYATAK